MRIENSTIKYINSNNQLLAEKKQSVSNIGEHSPSFGAGALGNGVISIMDAIDRGGLFASFVIQDFLGMNLPRTWVGLQRNKDITGQYNYQEAAEVAIREFLSGPVMFTVPMMMLWGVKRWFGKANDVPVDMIKALGDKFAQSVEGKNAAQLADMRSVKDEFYTTLFRDVLSKVYGDGQDVESQARAFAKDILEYEELVDAKKTTSFVDKIKGKKVEGTAEAKLSSIIEKYAEIVKSQAKNPSQNFLSVSIDTSGNPVSKAINGFIVDIRNFTEDAVETFAKTAGKENNANLQEFFTNFANKRAGSRVLTNISMLLGTIGFCSYIPKLYQLSDKNPGLIGLEGENNNAQTSKSNDTPEQDNKTANGQKQVAFSGAIDSLGRAVAKKDGKLSKFFNEFEFDSYNLSFMGFLTACGAGVLLPRLYHAREENEYKEILFRDTVTIGAIACLAKCVHQMVARMCTKVTGFALALKPEFKVPSKFKEYLAYLRPVKGHKVLNSAQLQSKYTNIDKYNEKIVGFAKFIDEQGGDVRKMFNADENALDLLKQIYETSEKSASVAFDNVSNKQLIEALTEITQNQKAQDKLEDLYKIFRKEDNAFLRKAKIMNSSFNFAILFAIAPIVFGVIIPKMNEALTKKRQKEKFEGNNTDNSVVQQVEVDQPKVSAAVKTLAINNAKKPVAFKEFIAS